MRLATKPLVLLSACLVFALTAKPALAQAPLAVSTLTALDPGVALTSVRLTGTVTLNAAQPETGSAVLEASGPNQSRVEFDFPGGSRIELRGDDAYGGPWGAWTEDSTGAESTTHAMALANCWVPAAWFVPQLAVLTPGHADAQISALADSEGQHHLQRVRVLTGQTAAMTAFIEQRSTATLDVDAAAGLPTALHYTLSPDDGAATSIPVEIRYSDYRRVDGVQIPFHVQWFMNHSLVYDIEIGSAEINPPLDAGDFAEPPAVAAYYTTPPQHNQPNQSGGGSQ